MRIYKIRENKFVNLDLVTTVELNTVKKTIEIKFVDWCRWMTVNYSSEQEAKDAYTEIQEACSG